MQLTKERISSLAREMNHINRPLAKENICNRPLAKETIFNRLLTENIFNRQIRRRLFTAVPDHTKKIKTVVQNDVYIIYVY